MRSVKPRCWNRSTSRRSPRTARWRFGSGRWIPTFPRSRSDFSSAPTPRPALKSIPPAADSSGLHKTSSRATSTRSRCSPGRPRPADRPASGPFGFGWSVLRSRPRRTPICQSTNSSRSCARRGSRWSSQTTRSRILPCRASSGCSPSTATGSACSDTARPRQPNATPNRSLPTTWSRTRNRSPAGRRHTCSGTTA